VRLNRALPIAGLLLAVAGCDAASPEIATPLRLDAFRPQPCTVLTPPQLTTLGLPTPGAPAVDAIEAKLRDYCTWWLGPAEDQVEVSMPKNQRSETLRGTYEQHGAGAFAYFEETTIAGYPAVVAGVTDNRAGGGCELRVGVADDLAVDVTVQATGADGCALAKNVAAEVVTTVAAGQ
jgi:uncharacterized protein DUF3558